MGNCPTQLGKAVRDNRPDKVKRILKKAGHKAPALINNDHSQDCIMDACNPTVGNVFYNAVFKNRTDIVKTMLKYGGDLYSLGYNDETPLHCAARLNNMDIARMLVDCGCDLYVSDDMGRFPIHSAARSVFNTSEMVKFLLAVGHRDDVNLQDYSGRTPLHDAICLGTLKTVKVLVNNGADVNARTKLGNTPLYFAKANNRMDIYDLLVENGAIVSRPSSTKK